MTIIDKIKSSVESIQVNGVPYFDYNDWFNASLELTSRNLVVLSQSKKFPLILLLLNIKEDVDFETKFADADVNLFIIGKTLKEKDNKYRHENTFPSLRTIEKNLYKQFRSDGVTFNNISRTEIFFNLKEPNKLNSVVDVIQINISDFRYYTDC